MQPLSLDLRLRILAAVDACEHSLRELADEFSVNISTIVRLLQRFRETGSAAPKPHGGGRPRALDADHEQRLLKLVKDHPDATLDELRNWLGVDCSIMSIWRALQRHGITRKKKTVVADERNSPKTKRKRRAFRETIARIPAKRLIFVDETGATTSMSRPCGRAPEGERVEASAPGRWEKVTLIAGMRLDGVVAPFAFEGATDTAAFETYVEEVLAPTLGPGDVVIWDNLGVHGSDRAQAAVEATGARIEPLPPYSPDLSPIEEMFSKLKSGLRSVAARTTEAVVTAMGAVLSTVTQSDILGWFRDRAPYATQS